MKTKISDANFPKSVEGRVYHLGLRAGELASRIITVGDPARARTIARYLDPSPPSGNVTGEESTSEQSVRPLLFELYSERGFLTLTGKYKGVPVSIVSIGMGRITSFPDHNNGLIDYLVTQNVGSLEMETFHLLHLAANWPRSTGLLRQADEKEEQQEPPPLTSMAVDPFILPSSSALSTDISSGDSPSSVSRLNGHKHSHTPMRRIRAAAVQMIFAERNSRVFISPQEVAILQEGSARGLLETLIKWRATHSPKLRSSI
ncbi:hypothetical protein FRC18_011439 [Serendipita sp. 400]|nr:hypothetical protein FRC18_011439 [Serendipita sp. 400]